MDDLSTLADENWLNDQVTIQHAKRFHFMQIDVIFLSRKKVWMEPWTWFQWMYLQWVVFLYLSLLKVINMYGELIMESTHHQVIMNV